MDLEKIVHSTVKYEPKEYKAIIENYKKIQPSKSNLFELCIRRMSNSYSDFKMFEPLFKKAMEHFNPPTAVKNIYCNLYVSLRDNYKK